MTNLFHSIAPLPLQTRMLLLAAAFATACGPALAAGPASPAKVSPAKVSPAKAGKPPACPKGQVEITSKMTGATHCAAIGGVTVMGGPQPILIPEKPAPKPRR